MNFSIAILGNNILLLKLTIMIRPPKDRFHLWHLIREAKIGKCWIRSPYKRHWYTPEQLEDRAKANPDFDIGMDDGFQIIDPIAALKEADEKIAEMQRRRDEFANKMIMYYKSLAK